MKISTIISFIALVGYLVVSGCTPDVVNPEFFGSITGTIVNSENDQRINGASIETNPPTEVLLTDEDGNFDLNDIPAGNYQIKISKSNFQSKSVSIKVTEDRNTSARIVLQPTEEEQAISKDILEAQVTSWIQRGSADSSFVDVEFRINNTSSSKFITQFEIYFEIHTDGETYYYEVSDKQLEPGEQNFGQFEKFVRDRLVDSVTVSDVWLTDNTNDDSDSDNE